MSGRHSSCIAAGQDKPRRCSWNATLRAEAQSALKRNNVLVGPKFKLPRVTVEEAVGDPVRPNGATICEDILDFDKVGVMMIYADGHHVIAPGGTIGAVFKIVADIVMVYRVLTDGRRYVLRFVLPGEYLGLSSNERDHHIAQSIGYTRALRVDLRHIGRSDGFVTQRRLADVVRRELANACWRLTVLGKMNSHERLASFLIDFKYR